MEVYSMIERGDAIKKLLQEDPFISDQKTFVLKLKERFGIETNQPVLSRDLRRLGVIKQEIKGELFYTLPLINPKLEILKRAILSIDHNETMIVIKTEGGLASFVGDFIDDQKDLDILGCIAGENTVFVACKSQKVIAETSQKIYKKLYEF